MCDHVGKVAIRGVLPIKLGWYVPYVLNGLKLLGICYAFIFYFIVFFIDKNTHVSSYFFVCESVVDPSYFVNYLWAMLLWLGVPYVVVNEVYVILIVCKYVYILL